MNKITDFYISLWSICKFYLLLRASSKVISSLQKKSKPRISSSRAQSIDSPPSAGKVKERIKGTDATSRRDNWAVMLIKSQAFHINPKSLNTLPVQIHAKPAQSRQVYEVDSAATCVCAYFRKICFFAPLSTHSSLSCPPTAEVLRVTS